jgi:hypothetical protein
VYYKKHLKENYNMEQNSFIKATGVYYPRALSEIKKSKDYLQPIYDALTNSFEAIRMLKSKVDKGLITLKLVFSEDLFSKEQNKYDFQEIIIEDSGIGVNDTEFERLETLNDDRKGFQNRGTGRVQLIHFFDKCDYVSTFQDEKSSTGYRERSFTLSKNKLYLDNNAIIYYKNTRDVSAEKAGTMLSLSSVLDDRDQVLYKELRIGELKVNIIAHYLEYLCENRDSLPDIHFQFVVNEEIKEEMEITSADIPPIDKQESLSIPYRKASLDGKSLEKLNKHEILSLKAFKISKDSLLRNEIKLTSKGEISKNKIELENLKPEAHIDDNRYLFLISGEYIDNRDSDTRGEINIFTKEAFKKAYGEMFNQEEEILIDDIQDSTNRKIELMYDEIKKHADEKLIELEGLKKMFLLNPDSIRDARIKLNDSEEEILEKVYKADAKCSAKRDAEIKNRVDALNKLNPSSKDFDVRFTEEVDALTMAIPLQNKIELTHYVARRKLVLDLFEKILNRNLEIQQGNILIHDEKLLHNLMFSRGSESPEESDLWIINEDFIYFNGSSEKRLNKIEINGQKLFKEEFTIEEEKYLSSLGENRKIKRPDVLLFPDEGKCIIIEFKTPLVNVSDHLTQIDMYASLIRNYSNDEIQITTFYGYLIGEGIDPEDVMGRVTRYEYSYQFDYLYRPSENVRGFRGRTNGSIYTEVIKYSTLLKRAMLRNRIFIDKLTNPCSK